MAGDEMSEAMPRAAQKVAGREAAAAMDAELDELLGSITVEMLRETFDQWTIGETAERLVAIRTGCFVAIGPRSLIRACVMADSAARLAEQLGLQAWLESLSGAELEAVWRSGPAAVFS
jgi:hypothetical protein